MIDRILERHDGGKSNGGGNGIHAEENEIDDLGTFGFLRGSRERAVMLELRKRDGNILAVGYGWLEKTTFDPSEGITLHLSTYTVRIKGRNLNAEARPKIKLFEGIARHRVPWIQEMDLGGAMADRGQGTVIDSIEW